MANVPMTEIDCTCGLPFSLPTRLYKQCYENGGTIYCPAGHALSWKETTADKLRRERDRLKQDQARLQDRVNEEREWRESAERSASAYKGQVTKIKKRVSGGVCPCCNRSFENLHRHMESKHPDYAKLDVIDGGKQTA